MVDAKVSASWDQVKDGGPAFLKGFLTLHPEYMKLFTRMGSIDNVDELQRLGTLDFIRMGQVVTGEVPIPEWCDKMAKLHRPLGITASHFKDIRSVVIDSMQGKGIPDDVVEAWKVALDYLVSEVVKLL